MRSVDWGTARCLGGCVAVVFLLALLSGCGASRGGSGVSAVSGVGLASGDAIGSPFSWLGTADQSVAAAGTGDFQRVSLSTSASRLRSRAEFAHLPTSRVANSYVLSPTYVYDL
jgi:hypothetical protein